MLSPLPVFVSLGSGLALVPIVRGIARRRQIVAHPRADRWHRAPTALLGGLAIWGATVLGVVTVLPEPRTLLGILGGGTFLCAVGVADDLLNLKPSTKLVAQIAAGAIAISLGIQIRFFDIPALNVAVSFLWIVAITNAVNLLDNMDGLAAGVGMIAATYLGWTYSDGGQTGASVISLALAGSLAAFLVFNYNPASIFMGDSGSMFVGFTLATLSLVRDQASGVLAFVAVPALTLLVPILDTTLVSVTRVLTRRPISEGGRDHTSHRLVVLGLSEREAVGVLWGLSIGAGGVAVLTERHAYSLGLWLTPLIILVFGLVGVYLSRLSFVQSADNPPDDASPHSNQLVHLALELTYKRRILEILVDVLLVFSCYYLAYGLRFEFDPTVLRVFLPRFYESVALVTAMTLLAFFWQGIYRAVWDYVGIDDLVRYVRACALSVLLSVAAVVILYRFEGYSRSVFLLYGLLLLVGMGGTRLSFRLMDDFLARRRPGRSVIIAGAGSGGEIAAREIRRNPALELRLLGFVDDDVLKHGRRMNGVPVLGGTQDLESIHARTPFQELLISSRTFSQESISRLRTFCNARGITLRFFRVEVSVDVSGPPGTVPGSRFPGGS